MRQFVNGVNQGDWALNSNCNGGNPSASPVDVWEIGFKGGTNNEFLTNGTYLDDIRFSTVARYTGTTTFTPNEAVTTSATMGLVSTTTTALTAPATGSIVTLIENNLGTATLNTDIKGYVSRNGGTGWDQVTLADKGTWGTNKKILTGMDTTFSNSASGTDMKYKIETANQSYTAAVPQGHAGGAGTTSSGAAGGGGAGSVGADAVSGSANGANGGDGLANDITGTSLFYAGGGGGAVHWDGTTGGVGGSSIGGNGSYTSNNATAGAVNTGSGGGGANAFQKASGTGGAGGSGIVVIRALTSETSGSTGNWDTTGTDGSHTWYKWTTVTSAGTFTPSQSASYEYLVVAGGGGGGGSYYAGGGGAGGYRAGTLTVDSAVSGISVGTGGAGGGNNVEGASGGNSIFSSITSNGGGGGAPDGAASTYGGSGGGNGRNRVPSGVSFS